MLKHFMKLKPPEQVKDWKYKQDSQIACWWDGHLAMLTVYYYWNRNNFWDYVNESPYVKKTYKETSLVILCPLSTCKLYYANPVPTVNQSKALGSRQTFAICSNNNKKHTPVVVSAAEAAGASLVVNSSLGSTSDTAATGIHDDPSAMMKTYYINGNDKCSMHKIDTTHVWKGTNASWGDECLKQGCKKRFFS